MLDNLFLPPAPGSADEMLAELSAAFAQRQSRLPDQPNAGGTPPLVLVEWMRPQQSDALFVQAGTSLPWSRLCVTAGFLMRHDAAGAAVAPTMMGPDGRGAMATDLLTIPADRLRRIHVLRLGQTIPGIPA